MQEQKKKESSLRLDVLDGLRGFAIILVFLNHIDSHFIAESVPSFFRPVIQFLFTSGNLGVTFFFILSGFLMGYLYKNPQPKEFIERRYARIFPPFLAMVFCMWIFRLFPTTNLVERIILMIGVAFFLRLVWIHIVERFHKGSTLIWIFFLVQGIGAVWYGFFIMRHPPIWFDSLPFLLREGTILLTNATLTLSLGNYIPLLDGVYWSLAPEMIFYLLYPLLFSNTVQLLQKKTKFFIALFCISLFPFFFGLSLLFKHTQGLSMLFIEYFIYFCGGIGIAVLVRMHIKNKILVASKKLITPIMFLSILFLAYYFLNKSTGATTLLVRLFLVFPFGFIVYSLVEGNTPLNTVFQKKMFLFLGTISYAMYIGHTAIVDGMHLIFRPTNAITNILFLLITGLIFLGVTTVLHFIIETPYFMFKPAKKNVVIEVQKSNKKIYGVLLVIILFLFFSVYTSQFNFFSLQKKYKNIIPSSQAISDIPFTFTFTSQDDNMGVILVHLSNTVGNEKDKSNVNPYVFQRFQIRMKEKGANNWYASQDTAPAEIGDSMYPFGFPIISNSKNKTYVVEMSIKNIDHRSTVVFNKDIYQLTTIHQIQKQTLLKNPVKLIAHVSDKLQTAFMDPEAKLTALCVAPFFILLFAL
jgi:peptidoglycan/LPS O-acetylase OafA/YrhL